MSCLFFISSHQSFEYRGIYYTNTISNQITGICWPNTTALYHNKSSHICHHWHSRFCKGRKEGNVLFNDALNTFYLRYMASDIWLRTIQIAREETRCRYMGYSFRLTARVILYAPSHRQDNTYHGLCYTSRGALAGTRNSSMDLLHEGSIRRPVAP